ncbi:MAG: protein kinase domain-containing protein [Micromonosporaceae bacterium]
MISPGTTLGGRYRLDERIASGGMGDVWRSVDEVLGRTVAVKILLPALLDEAGFTERFRVEARTMATINHPGVVDIYDYGSDDAAGAYLVMEYVEGDALSRTLAKVGRLTPARTMALVAQAADALHAAHEKGIVHRDVKPGNLLVRPNGTLVLTDFGIARSAGAAQLTAAGSVLGTASYISPEQAMGQSATPLSDIYALGVVAYQCLSGRRPFEGENPLEIAMRHVRENPPPLPVDILPPIRSIVERAMAKDPASRWPTAAAFAAVARGAAGVTAGTRPAAPAAPPGAGSVRPVSGGPSTPTPTPSPLPTSPVAAGMAAAAVGSPVGLPPGSPPVIAGPGTRMLPPQPGAPGSPRPMGGPGYPAGVAAPGYGRPPVPPGQFLMPAPPRRNSGLLVIAIVIAVVLVAICIGAAIAMAQNQGLGQNGMGRIGESAAMATATATATSEGRLRR